MFFTIFSLLFLLASDNVIALAFKIIGRITNLAVAAANDFDLGALLTSRATAMTTTDLPYNAVMLRAEMIRNCF
jgi:hypothetical protein